MNILLVEDNPGDLRLMQEALAATAAADTVLHAVSSGNAALDFLRRAGPHTVAPAPDLVLLDLNLPGLHGMAVLAEIKRDPALLTTPVVVFTSSEASSDVLQAYRTHANAYITKPVDFDQFVATILAIQTFWRLAALPLRGLAATPAPAHRATTP
ncbi:MAG: response regulator [Aquabacterium sp.]|nr:response regulator [Aquabacterium sp.]